MLINNTIKDLNQTTTFPKATGSKYKYKYMPDTLTCSADEY